MAILASSEKMPFDKLLFIALYKGWHKTLAADFTGLRGIISKPTAFLCQVHFLNLNLNIFSGCPANVVRRCNWADLIFGSSLNKIDARMIDLNTIEQLNL